MTADLNRIHLRLLDDAVSLAGSFPEDPARRTPWRAAFDLIRADAERIEFAIESRKRAKL